MKKISAIVLVFLLFLAPLTANTAEASYINVSSKTYYGLADSVYNVNKNMTRGQLTKQTFNFNKNLVAIDFTNINSAKNQPIFQLDNPKKKIDYDTNPYSGFKAITVVDKTKKQLIISFSGSDDFNDYGDALRLVSSSHSYQEIEALLYVKYIYQTYGKDYKNYKWYLTGHSLGGNLAVTTYLNLQRDRKFNSRGSHQYTYMKVKSSNIKVSGVYVFNPLPISKAQLKNDTLWKNNVNKKYSSIIYSHVIKNEWLHVSQQIGKNDLAYFGNVKFENNPKVKGTFKVKKVSKDKSNIIVAQTRFNRSYISDYATISSKKITKDQHDGMKATHSLKTFKNLVK